MTGFTLALAPDQLSWVRTHAACSSGTSSSARYACFAPADPGRHAKTKKLAALLKADE